MRPQLTAADVATLAAVRARLGTMPALDELVTRELAALGLSAPADPDRVAYRLGLVVYDAHVPAGPCDAACAGLLVGRRIFVCEAWPDRLFSVAHELGHYLARRAGLEVPGERTSEAEDRADYLACALLEGRRP